MGLKIYTLFSILFILAVGVYVHLNVDAFYTFTLYENSYNYPVAVWFVIPVTAMFLLSLAHMFFYGFRAYLSRKSLEKDIVTVKKLVIESITGDSSTLELKHKDLKAVNLLLKNAQLNPKASLKTEDEEVDKLLSEIDKLNSGEEAELAQFKLPKTSHLEIKNAAIKLKNDRTYAEEILKKFADEKYLVDLAIKEFVSYADKKRIEKHRSKLTKEAVITLLSRYKAEENALTFPHEEAVGYIKDVKFNSKDFITIVRKLKTQVEPEALLELVYEFKNDFPEAIDSWIYINLELERIDVVKDIFESADDDEFISFRKYLAIKEAGIKVALDEFVE